MIEFYDNSNSQPKYTGHEQIRKEKSKPTMIEKAIVQCIFKTLVV